MCFAFGCFSLFCLSVFLLSFLFFPFSLLSKCYFVHDVVTVLRLCEQHLENISVSMSDARRIVFCFVVAFCVYIYLVHLS